MGIPTVFIVSNKPEFLDRIENIINNIEKTNTFKILNKELFQTQCILNKIDLVITHADPEKITDDIMFYESCLDFSKHMTPILFVIPQGKKVMSYPKGIKLTIDFAWEDIPDDIMFNKISLMLKVSTVICQRKLIDAKEKGIWDILNYSNIFVLVLDKNLKIALCNKYLAKHLGYNDEKDVIGLEWKNFLPPSTAYAMKEIYEAIKSGREEFKEFTTEIIPKEGNSFAVKWFNSYINGEDEVLIRIGTPIGTRREHNEGIDALRLYYRNVIDKDRTTIQSIKELTLKQGLMR